VIACVFNTRRRRKRIGATWFEWRKAAVKCRVRGRRCLVAETNRTAAGGPKPGNSDEEISINHRCKRCTSSPISRWTNTTEVAVRQMWQEMLTLQHTWARKPTAGLSPPYPLADHPLCLPSGPDTHEGGGSISSCAILQRARQSMAAAPQTDSCNCCQLS